MINKIAEIINPKNLSEGVISSQLRRILSRWMAFAAGHYNDWVAKPECGCFFGGAYCYSVETSATTMVAAVLAVFGKYNDEIIGVSKERLIEMAVRSIRYMCFTHHTGPSECVRNNGKDPRFSNKKWGHKEGNFFMSSQTGVSVSMLGLSAWILWDRLDDETKKMTGDVLEFYADEYSGMTPGTGTYNDTQCEENAWTSLGIAAALYMFPDHPNSEKWRDAYIKWSLNSVSTFKDKLDNELDKVSGNCRGGYKFKDKLYGISSVTFHPDFTTENHGYVHPDYMGAGIILRTSSAVFPLLRGEQPLGCLFYNSKNLYEKVLKPWCAQDGNPVPVQGQDWFYHRHQNKILIHTAMNLFFNDADAAMFERKCIDITFRRQESNGRGQLLEKNGENLWVTPGTQSVMDMEYGAIRTVALSYLLHLMMGDGVDPEYPKTVMEKLSGNYIYPYGGVYIHRTPDTFTSFTTRCSVMGLSQPMGGLWDITSDFQSFTGVIREAETDSGFFDDKKINWDDISTHTIRQKVNEYENGFSITAEIPRANCAVNQLVSFSALPDGRAVYIEKTRAVRDVDIDTYETGRISIGNEDFRFIPEHAKGHREVYFNGRPTRFYGRYGGDNLVLEQRGLKHVNVDDKIGYLLYGSAGIVYTNRHTYPKWKGLEDTLILNKLNPGKMKAGDETDVFAVMTLPNTGIPRMDREYLNTDITLTNNESYILRTHQNRVSVNFSDEAKLVKEEIPLRMNKVRLFSGRTSINDGDITCRFYMDAFSSQTDQVMGMIRLKENMVNLEISCAEGFITIRNTSEFDTEYVFSAIGINRKVMHKAGETLELMIFGDTN